MTNETTATVAITIDPQTAFFKKDVSKYLVLDFTLPDVSETLKLIEEATTFEGVVEVLENVSSYENYLDYVTSRAKIELEKVTEA